MDLRLDFYNALNEYAAELNNDDALLVLSHNKRDGDCITLLAGDWEILSVLMSEDGYVNYKDKKQAEVFNNIRKMIVDITLNICKNDDKIRKSLFQTLGDIEYEKNHLCKCKDCGHEWSAYETDNFNFSCCPICGSSNIKENF